MKLEKPNNNQRSKWPKTFPELTPEQQIISDDFMRRWHEILPNRYGILEKFNHKYPLYSMNHFKNRKHRIKTLEIGAGLGAHIAYEDLTNQEYHVVELRQNMIRILNNKYPEIQAFQGDIEQGMNFSAGYFDRILAVHVLEHLSNLPAALEEIDRLLAIDGIISFVLPCEGGLAYEFARQISSKRIFEKTYQQSYSWFIEREHVNTYQEIRAELLNHFQLIHERRFPLPFLPVTFNLVSGLTLVKK